MKLSKNIFIVILIVSGILLVAAYKLPITGKIEATSEFGDNKLSGEILSVNYEPDEPKILERLTATFVVKNNGIEKSDYLLEFGITRNGQLKYEDEFTFSLLPDQTISFSPTYSPGYTGEHNIVVRLYGNDKTKLLDEKILTFVAQSDIGPFDLEVDMPSRMIGLGDSLPITIIITNAGIHGTDVDLNLNLRCTGGSVVSKNMYIFLNGSSSVNKQLFMRTCGEVGQHTLIASINLYEKELLSSKNQFYVNMTVPEVLMTTPHWIKVEGGKKTIFGIELTNLNALNLINIKPFVYGIPPDWVLIKPSSSNILKPNETIIFTAIIEAPENTETEDYEITIGVGGDNMFSESESILSVTGVAAKPLVPSLSPYQLLSSYWGLLVLIFAVVLLSYVLLERRKLRKQDEKRVKRGFLEEFEELKLKWKEKKETKK